MRLVTRNFNQPMLGTNLWNNLLADDFFAKLPAKRTNGFSPRTVTAVNIKENDAKYFIEVAAPGFVKTDFSIELDKNLLTISAKKVEEKTEETKEQGYTYQEFASKEFKRTFTLPEGTVNVEAIEASYDAGVLTVSIPKKEKEEKKINIEIS